MLVAHARERECGPARIDPVRFFCFFLLLLITMNAVFSSLRRWACLLTAALATAGHAAGALENPLSENAVRATQDSMRAALGNRPVPAADASGTPTGAGRLPVLAIGTGGNVAGVLEFCVKHNVLNRATVDPVRATLLSRVSLERLQARDSGYQQGLAGLLRGIDHQTLDLNSAAPQLREQACDYVFSNTKSLT